MRFPFWAVAYLSLSPLFGKISYSTFNDLLQSLPSFPLISLHPPFHHFQELWPLFLSFSFDLRYAVI